MYEHFFKRLIDIIMSTCGILFLFPVWLIIAIAIKIDDPGPVFFKQKRIAKNKNGKECFFYIYKYRSMKMCTPHDMPTHLLNNPEQYITKVGGILRKMSLEGNDIIRQTTKSLENKGFREVSPILFFNGCNQFSNDFRAMIA